MKKCAQPPQQKGKALRVLLTLLCLSCSFNLHADPLIDHVASEVHEGKEVINLFFNQPVQYLYHTPHSNTKTMLLGFYVQSGKRQSSRNRPIAFKKIKFLQDLELFYEAGFNPHVYFEFNQAVKISIQNHKNLRGFTITISRPNQ